MTTRASSSITAMAEPSPPCGALDADAADVVGEHVGRAGRPALGDQRDRLEHLDGVDDGDDGAEQQRAAQQRQRDPPQQALPGGAVDAAAS